MSTANVELTQIAYRLGWTIVHSLWQGAAVALILGAVLSVMRRRSAQARYLASLTALALIVTTAAVTFQLTGSRVEGGFPRGEIWAPTAAPALSQPIAARPGAPEMIIVPLEQQPSLPGSHETRSATFRIPRPLLERATARLEPILPWLTIAWAVGVVAMGVWHAGGWLAAQRLRVLGVRPPEDHVIALSRRVAGRLGLGAPVRVLVSMLANTPMVIGWLRPVVLLPAAIVSGLTPAQLEGILAHELAHIRRYDYLVNLLQVLTETLLFYHPAVWWISRRVRLEREQCCDEIAVRACGDRCAYAESLVALEEARVNSALALAAGGSGGKELLARIRRILRRDEPSTHTGRVALAAVVILVAGAVPLSLLNAAPATRSSAAPPSALAAMESAPATQASSPRPTILLVTPGSYFLERALERSGWGLVTVAPNEFDAYAKAHPPAGDVIVFDRWAPKAAPPGQAMYVDAIPPQSGLSVETNAAGQPVEIKNADDVRWAVADPILKDMTVGHALFVAQALKLHVPADWRTLASNAAGHLIVAHDAGGKRQIVVAFDVQQSNWPFDPAFPMFLHRAVQWLTRDEPAPTAGSPAAQEAAKAAGPATSTRPSPAARLQFRVEARPGADIGETDELKDPVSRTSYRFRKDAVFTEADVKSAREERIQNGELTVNVEFTDAGAARLLAVTSANLDRRMAILFDGRVLSMPVIRAAISRAASITGGANGMTGEQAKALVEAIGSARPPVAPATGPATVPATRQAAAFTADCVLSGRVDDNRKVLATPMLNMKPGSTIRFVYAGKPPVVIERAPGQEAGIELEVRADQQPGGSVRIFCRLKHRDAASQPGADLEERALLNAHLQKLIEAERSLNEAKEMLAEAQRDMDRRRIGLTGSQPYTLEEICRVDPTLLPKVNALNEQQTTYEYLLPKYGTNYPQTKEALQLLQIRRQDIDEAVKRFNEEFFIVTRNDGSPPRAMSKNLAKLQALVENDQREFDAETAEVNKLTRAGGSETDQIVKLGEPVAVELADGTRLEVAVRTSDKP